MGDEARSGALSGPTPKALRTHISIFLRPKSPRSMLYRAFGLF